MIYISVGQKTLMVISLLYFLVDVYCNVRTEILGQFREFSLNVGHLTLSVSSPLLSEGIRLLRDRPDNWRGNDKIVAHLKSKSVSAAQVRPVVSV